MARFLNRWVFLTVVIALLLAIFLPPFINVNRFRPQIAGDVRARPTMPV